MFSSLIHKHKLYERKRKMRRRWWWKLLRIIYSCPLFVLYKSKKSKDISTLMLSPITRLPCYFFCLSLFFFLLDCKGLIIQYIFLLKMLCQCSFLLDWWWWRHRYFLKLQSFINILFSIWTKNKGGKGIWWKWHICQKKDWLYYS
jgi:hypothetical protein